MTLERIVENRAATWPNCEDGRRFFAITSAPWPGSMRPAFTCFGRPGTAKTHTVRAVLEQEIREIYVYQRGHLTPMGLFELIAANPGRSDCA